jgi:GTP cyclohydrolase FolE2
VADEFDASVANMRFAKPLDHAARDGAKRLDAETGHIEMSFPYFINKKAPVSGVQSLMDYEVQFDRGSTRPARRYTSR